MFIGWFWKSHSWMFSITSPLNKKTKWILVKEIIKTTTNWNTYYSNYITLPKKSSYIQNPYSHYNVDVSTCCICPVESSQGWTRNFNGKIAIKYWDYIPPSVHTKRIAFPTFDFTLNIFFYRLCTFFFTFFVSMCVCNCC